MAEQLQFPFASLDFPGRTVLYMQEVAEKLGCSIDQVYDLADDGSLPAVNIASKGAARRELRVPIEGWRKFIIERLTGPMQLEFLRSLPRPTLRELQQELSRLLAA